jgi:uncharacterized protein (DUF1697 family)
MPQAVFLRGVNVGGHRAFRPSSVATALGRLEVVNIGAAGTFVVRRPVSRAQLRAELASHLPFRCEIVIVSRRDIIALLEQQPFARRPARPDIVRFVSVCARRPRAEPALPMGVPSQGRWLVKVLRRHGPFVCGLYRREMKAIGCLARLDERFGVPLTTRSWSTMLAVARALDTTTREH